MTRGTVGYSLAHDGYPFPPFMENSGWQGRTAGTFLGYILPILSVAGVSEVSVRDQMNRSAELSWSDELVFGRLWSMTLRLQTMNGFWAAQVWKVNQSG